MKKYLLLVFMPFVCWADIGLDSHSTEVAKDYMGTREIPITGTGDWTATTDATWLKIVRASSASASKPVFRVTGRNYSTDVREAVIMVNELPYVVRQLAYGATISPEQVELGAEGMTEAGLVQIDVEEATSGVGISWTAKLGDPLCDWINILPQSGVGDGAVSYRVDANTNPVERVGIVTIAGQRFTVAQAGSEQPDPGETVVATVVPTKFTLSASSHEVEVSVTADPDASWTIENESAAWINVFNPGTGKGNATLGIAVAANRSVYSRTGTLVIGGSKLTIIQKGSTDFLLSTDPASASYAYNGGTKTLDVSASGDMEWSVASLASWITVQTPRSLSGCGEGTLKYQVALNTTLAARTNALEFTAKIPHPEIEISRGLMQWQGDCQAIGYAFDDPALRDAEVTGETEGVWFTITDHMNSLHRLFDLNNGQAGLYVTTENRLVLDDTAGQVVDLNFPVEQNVTYDLFVASSETNTVLYGGVQGCGAYRKLYEGAPMLKITGYGRSTKPSNTTSTSEELLIWGRASKTAYYYWTRMLNANEMLNMPSERPRIVLPTEAAYTNLYSHTPFDRQFVKSRDVEVPLSVSNISYRQSSRLLSQKGMTGTIVAPNRELSICIDPKKSWEDSRFLTIGGADVIWHQEHYRQDSYEKWYFIYGLHQDTPHMCDQWSYNIWAKIEKPGEYDIFQPLRVSTVRTKLNGADYFPNAGKDRYKLQVSGTGFRFVENGVSSERFGDGVDATGQWIMLTVTSNGNKMTLYLNGQDIGNIILTGDYRRFCLDGWCAYGNDGMVVFDDIKTFDACLSTDQIKSIFDLEKPLKFRHVVTQEAATPSLSCTSCTCESAQGEYTVGLTLPNSRIRWTATTDCDWITLPVTNGTGSATFGFTVAKNTETHERRGVITIAGIQYEVIQSGTGISFANTIYEIAYDGTEVLDIPVIASDSDTHWTVVEDPDRYWWLGADNYEGYGSSMLSVWGAANSNEMDSRYGILMVSGVWLYVFQRDYGLSVAPASTTVMHAGGTGELAVATEEGDCGNWQAITDVDWISLDNAEDGEVAGTGDGAIVFSVAENDIGSDRVGRIVVAGETCVITQKTKGVVTELTIDGPTEILTGSTANYTARLVYSSGWTEQITPNWVVYGCEGATMTADGRLVSGMVSGEVTVNATYDAAGTEYRANLKVAVTLCPTRFEIIGRTTPLCPYEKRALAYQVTFTDGTTGLVKPTSVAVTTGTATVDADGVLTAGGIEETVSLNASYATLGITVSASYSTSITAPSCQQALNSALKYELTGWKAVGAESYTGDYSMRAGPLEVGETAEISTTLVGAGTFSCWMKTATSVDSSVAYGEVLLDGVAVKTVWGVTEWTNISFSVPTWDEHRIVWRYVKTSDGSCDEDAIWLDDVAWTPADPPVKLSALEVTGDSALYFGQTTTLTCTAFYSDGSRTSVEPDWTITEGASLAEISSLGELTAKRTAGTVEITASYIWLGETKKATYRVEILVSPDEEMSGVSIEGADTLYAGDSCRYLCRASFLDGSSKYVAGTWQISSGSAYASIASDGTLVAKDADGTAIIRASHTYAGITKSTTKSVTIKANISVPTSVTGGKVRSVPVKWTRQFNSFGTRFGSDLVSAMERPTGKRDGAGHALSVWDDYVMGTDPTDSNDVFRAKLEMVDGVPRIDWEPNLNTTGVSRVYTVWGRTSLDSSSAWERPVNSAKHNFFKVDVDMADSAADATDSPGTMEPIIQKDNAWVVAPSLSLVEFETGTTITVNPGTPKFGTVAANYTAADMPVLAAGDYEFTSTVSETPDYTGLSKTIKFTVKGKSVDGLYCVVDLTSSPYAVTYLSAVPSGGWTDVYKKDKIVLRRIEPGSYKQQGIKTTTITKPFYIGVFELTQGQYARIMGNNPANTNYGIGPTYPVNTVSYNDIRGSDAGSQWPASSAVDATSFMGVLRKRTGLAFDLPTGAQWEYATRAGTTTPYYWGYFLDSNNKYAWYAQNSDNKLHAVGLKLPNDWGLYDTIGNVSEHCLDYVGNLTYGNDPKGPATYDIRRIELGGSMEAGESDCSLNKLNGSYGGSSSAVGFRSKGLRVALPIPE